MLSQESTRYIVLSLTVTGLVFVIMSTASDYWETATHNDSHIFIGLWRGCGTVSGKKLCTQRPKSSAALKVTTIFMVLGCLGYLAATTYCAIILIKKELSIRLLAGILYATAFLLLVALCLYTVKLSTTQFTYGWSYIVGWCSTVVSFIAAGLCFVGHGGYQSIA
ncbi:lens fiber membrane intrinsic protein [Hydra vulgaris]